MFFPQKPHVLGCFFLSVLGVRLNHPWIRPSHGTKFKFFRGRLNGGHTISGLFVKFCILMLYNHDVIGLQQNRTYIHHASLVSTTLATEHAWHCGMSNT